MPPDASTGGLEIVLQPGMACVPHFVQTIEELVAER